MSRKRRERLGKKHKREYQPVRIGEVIPPTHAEQVKWLHAIFVNPPEWTPLTLNQIFPTETHGKKLNALFDGPLRRLRDHIAHGILDSGSYLHFDDLASIREISKMAAVFALRHQANLKERFPSTLPFVLE